LGISFLIVDRVSADVAKAPFFAFGNLCPPHNQHQQHGQTSAIKI
jgi:hypothetical protein